MTETLVGLAERFVALNSELNATREAMKRLLMNGAETRPNPFAEAERPGEKRTQAQLVKQPPQRPKARMQTTPSTRSTPPAPQATSYSQRRALAEEAGRKIISLLQATPGMRTTQIAKATNAKTNTTTERLKRLQARGSVQSDGEGGWSAPPPSPAP
jgi:hypothetical protein